MTITYTLLFLAFGYFTFQLGKYKGGKGPPRHQHDWVIVEKEILQSAVEQAKQGPAEIIAGVKKSSGYNYVPNTQSVLLLTKKEAIVSYRCFCGAEKVERI